jgi:hypothetical protein
MAVFEYVGGNRSCVSISVRDTRVSCDGADASHSPIIESNESGFILSRLGGRRSRRPLSLRLGGLLGGTRAARGRVLAPTALACRGRIVVREHVDDPPNAGSRTAGCDRVRLIKRGGYDWTSRYPWIVEAAVNNRHKQFVIYGEAVILGVDGISTRWILQGTMMQYSSMLSIFWRSAAMTCAPSPVDAQASFGSTLSAPTGRHLSATSNKARSARIISTSVQRGR